MLCETYPFSKSWNIISNIKMVNFEKHEYRMPIHIFVTFLHIHDIIKQCAYAHMTHGLWQLVHIE